jgi:hypothetical protein
MEIRNAEDIFMWKKVMGDAFVHQGDCGVLCIGVVGMIYSETLVTGWKPFHEQFRNEP